MAPKGRQAKPCGTKRPFRRVPSAAAPQSREVRIPLEPERAPVLGRSDLPKTGAFRQHGHLWMLRPSEGGPLLGAWPSWPRRPAGAKGFPSPFPSPSPAARSSLDAPTFGGRVFAGSVAILAAPPRRGEGFSLAIPVAFPGSTDFPTPIPQNRASTPRAETTGPLSGPGAVLRRRRP